MIDADTRGAGYAGAARIFHWLVAALVLVVWPFGMLLSEFKDGVKLFYYGVHESLGFLLVLWLMCARLAVRLIRKPPPALPAPARTRLAALWVHRLLYVFLFLQPVSGFLATNAHGFPLSWFGLVEVWSPVGKAPGIAPVFSWIHWASGWILLGLFALHLGGVLYHRLVLRDRILERMT